MDFEIWAYRGIIGILLIVIWQVIQSYSKRQEEKNKVFFDTINELKQAIERLTTTLIERDKLCTFKHDMIEEWQTKMENKR